MALRRKLSGCWHQERRDTTVPTPLAPHRPAEGPPEPPSAPGVSRRLGGRLPPPPARPLALAVRPKTGRPPRGPKTLFPRALRPFSPGPVESGRPAPRVPGPSRPPCSVRATGPSHDEADLPDIRSRR
ncbi:hypothetical protein Franean1_0361 [Parafrankia sp. EAN1pec]|nr:hypothetical protein Franean1_0361 [Frankia sp. EAN1pec]